MVFGKRRNFSIVASFVLSTPTLALFHARYILKENIENLILDT